jgi:molybdopterin-guanine dinucleotide biosynthesis protein A
MSHPQNIHLAAIILTGGASRRMGVDKGAQMWGDRRAVDHVADLARTLGARRILTAGEGDYGLERVRDPAPQSGPVAGVLAGLSVLSRNYGRVLVLAVDAPTLRAEDLAPLMASGPPGAAFEGFPLPMIIDPRSTPADARADWPLRRLTEQAGLAMLALPAQATDRIRGANTGEERLRLLRMAGLA